MKFITKPKHASLIVISFLLIVIINGCSKVNYIEDIPKNFSYSNQEIQDKLNNKPTAQKATPEESTKSILSDRQLYLRDKYSKMMLSSPESIQNFALYNLVDLWLGVPYSTNGMSKTTGVSTAGFVSNYYESVYKIRLPGNPLGLYKSEQIQLFNSKTNLATGDLIFLRQNSLMPVSDVAMYLTNDYVLYSSPDRGLFIYKFSDPYFQERYTTSGRVNY